MTQNLVNPLVDPVKQHLTNFKDFNVKFDDNDAKS